MSINHLKVIIAVTASILFAGFSAQASETTATYRVSGEVTWVDTKLGELQLESVATGEITTFRISEHETRVTEPLDKKFLTIADLWPGQEVTIDVINGQEGKIVQKITLIPRPTSDAQEAYGEVQAIDASSGTLVLTARSRVGGSTEVNLYHFDFDPKTVVAMRNPSQVPVQLEVKPGDLVKINFVVRNGKRRANSITLYPPRVINTTTTTTTVTTTK
jgi:hypothetical protein